MATVTGLTIEDFERLSDEEVRNRELVDGELVDVSGNVLAHNLIRDRLVALFLWWLRAGQAGTAVAEQEYDFLGNAHGPDVSFIGPEKLQLLDKLKRVQRFVPDLAIEIASPNDTYFSLLRKKDCYRRAGTSEVWLISMETREITIYSVNGDRILHSGDAITSPLLPGFTLSIDDLFAGI